MMLTCPKQARAVNDRPHPALVLVILSVVCLYCIETASAQRYQLGNMLFDPVAITPVNAAEAMGDEAPLYRELTTLPAQNPVTLRDWQSGQAAGSSTRSPAADARDLEAFQQRIIDEELDNGPYSMGLPQLLVAFGSALQSAGDLEAAHEHFEQALHITRINHGLFSSEQVPIMHKAIENHVLRGDLDQADSLQQSMMHLYRKLHGAESSEIVQALDEYADWNIFVFSPAAALSASGTWQDIRQRRARPLNLPGDEETIREYRLQRLVYAHNLYWTIVQMLDSDRDRHLQSLVEYEKRLARTNYFYALNVPAKPQSFVTGPDLNALHMTQFESTPGVTAQVPSPPFGGMGFQQGSEALSRRLEYVMASETADTMSRIQAHLDLADWQLLTADSVQRNRALQRYETVFEHYHAAIGAEALYELLDPALPVRLPTFVPHRYSREANGVPADQALAYQGYLDIRFELNRYGYVRNLDILAASSDTPDEVVLRLRRHLRDAQFRPRLDPNGLRVRDSVLLRYYYAY